MLHIKDNFAKGAPISQVPASWFNQVAGFINSLIGGFAITLTKNADGYSSIDVDEDQLDLCDYNVGTPTQIGESPSGELVHEGSVLWERQEGSSGNGAEILVTGFIERVEGGFSGERNVMPLKLTISRGGLITKVETVENLGTQVYGPTVE